MFKLMASGAVLATLLAANPSAAQALGPDAASCRAGSNGSAVLVNVNGLRARTGKIRVAIYGSNPSEFLERGRTLRKIDVPVTAAGPMRICVALPRAGRYAVAVRHDLDGNGRSGWNDGGGFSRNPSISLTSLKPRHQDVAINVGNGIQPVNVVMLYRFGLSIRPVRGS